MKARTITGRQEIVSILSTDRIYAAYPIGDLAAGWFEQCEWTIAEEEGKPVALAMIFSGFSPPALFLMGETKGVAHLLADSVTPPAAHLTLRSEHQSAVSQFYRLAEQRQMYRIRVDQASFRPIPGPTVRLSAGDIDALNRLYAWGGADFFTSFQLEQGVYHAIALDGELVAAAGTHVVAPDYGIAAVGNVYTHPAHRNHGYATACTGAVAAELLAMGCATVVLNVWQDNAPAVRAYSKLGFRTHCPYIESAGQRRSTLVRRVQDLAHRYNLLRGIVEYYPTGKENSE